MAINNIDRKDYLSDAAIKGNVGAIVLARARADRFIPDSPDLFVQKSREGQRESSRPVSPKNGETRTGHRRVWRH